MKRFLNKAKQVEIVPFGTNSNYKFKFKLDTDQTATENEILTGEYSGNRYFFIYKGGHLYSISHDDFTYDFLRLEKEDLQSSYTNLNTYLTGLNISEVIIKPDTPPNEGE